MNRNSFSWPGAVRRSRGVFPGLRALRVAACALGAVAAGFALDQPQWGERLSRNMVSGETGLPATFDPATGANLKWSARLGSDSYPTPVIAAGRVYMGTNNRVPRDPRHTGDRGVLLCLDERTGELRWQLVVPKITTSRYWDWPNIGLCSPATVVDGRVYVISNRGEVLCLDPAGLADGNQGPFLDEARHQTPAGEEPIPTGERDADILWLFDPVGQLGVRQHDAAHGSILSHGPYLYVNTSNGVNDTHGAIEAPDAPSLIVLERATGRLVATDGERIGPRIFHGTWCSPAVIDHGGQPVIVFAGGDGVVYGFEALDSPPPAGEVRRLRKLWHYDFDPTAPKENVHRYARNRTEGPSVIKGLPVTHGGRVYVTGGGDGFWGKNLSWLKVFEPPVSGPGEPREVWAFTLNKQVMSSAVVHDGLVYVGDTGRQLYCLEAATGRPVWGHELQGELWATPLVADGKVYFASRRGEVLVFATGREKRLLGETALGGAISATPVAANGVLYIATMTHLYAVQAGGK